MIREAKITYGDAVNASDMILHLEGKKQEIANDWSGYMSTSLSNIEGIISEKLKKIFGDESIDATTPMSNSQYSLVKLTLDFDFLRIANHDGGDRNLKKQMKNTPNIVIHDFQFIHGATDSYNSDVLQLNSPTVGLTECLRETIVINSGHLFKLGDVTSLMDAIIKMIKDEGHTFHMPSWKNDQNFPVIKESTISRIVLQEVRKFLRQKMLQEA